MPPQLKMVRHDERRPFGASDISALRAGEDWAIDSCYRTHAGALLSLAYRLTGSHSDAEDVVHDVFVSLPNTLVNYEERGQFDSWLRRVTARAALMHHRKRVSRRETPRALEVVSQTDASRRAVDASTRSAVNRALGQLSPALRHVFLLRFVEQYSHSEIATALDISIGTSEVRLNRALTRLRELLGGIR